MQYIYNLPANATDCGESYTQAALFTLQHYLLFTHIMQVGRHTTVVFSEWSCETSIFVQGEQLQPTASTILAISQSSAREDIAEVSVPWLNA